MLAGAKRRTGFMGIAGTAITAESCMLDFCILLYCAM